MSGGQSQENSRQHVERDLGAQGDLNNRPQIGYTMLGLRAGLNSPDQTERLRAEQALSHYVEVRDQSFDLPESQCESAEALHGYLTAEMQIKARHAEKSMEVYPVLQGEQIVGGIQTVLQESMEYGKYAIHAELVGSIGADLNIQIAAIEQLRQIAQEQNFDCVIIFEPWCHPSFEWAPGAPIANLEIRSLMQLS